MRKGILSILSLACMGTFISCEKKSATEDTETRAVSIDVSETHMDILKRLVDKNEDGELTFYEDEQLTKAHENFREALGMKEIIQIPNPASTGEFIDKVISIPFNTDMFSKVNLVGEFSNGKLIHISTFSADHKLVVDGQELGTFPAFYLDAKEVAKTDLVKELSDWPELNRAAAK